MVVIFFVPILVASCFFLLHTALHVQLCVVEVLQVLVAVGGAGDPRVQHGLAGTQTLRRVDHQHLLHQILGFLADLMPDRPEEQHKTEGRNHKQITTT
jgi:hypothetical protein